MAELSPGCVRRFINTAATSNATAATTQPATAALEKAADDFDFVVCIGLSVVIKRALIGIVTVHHCTEMIMSG